MKSIFVKNVYEECEYKSKKLIGQYIIAERDLDCPVLKPRDTIYDKELNRNFFIHEVKRDTNNTYTYVVEEEFERTIESLNIELKKLKNDYNDMWNCRSELLCDFERLQVTKKKLEVELNTLKSNIIVKIMIKLGLIS